MLINSTDETVSDGGGGGLPADRRCNGIEEKSEILKLVGEESAHSCSLAFPIQRLLNVALWLLSFASRPRLPKAHRNREAGYRCS